MDVPGEKSGMNSTVEKILVLLLTNHLPDNCTRTSKQIGLTIPPNVLARADKLIKQKTGMSRKARGDQFDQRPSEGDRRAEKCLVDVVSSGANRDYQQFYLAETLDPIKSRLVLVELADQRSGI